jgi:hypothetical protein
VRFVGSLLECRVELRALLGPLACIRHGGAPFRRAGWFRRSLPWLQGAISALR